MKDTLVFVLALLTPACFFVAFLLGGQDPTARRHWIRDFLIGVLLGTTLMAIFQQAYWGRSISEAIVIGLAASGAPVIASLAGSALRYRLREPTDQENEKWRL